MSGIDLTAAPSEVEAVLAALATRDAQTRQSAVPETRLAADAGVDRGTVERCCDWLCENAHAKRVEWTDAGERLRGYFLVDRRARRRGLEHARERALVGG